LEQQIQYLDKKFKETQHEKNKSDHACSQKLFEGIQVVDSLIKELDEIKHTNILEEDTQV